MNKENTMMIKKDEAVEFLKDFVVWADSKKIPFNKLPFLTHFAAQEISKFTGVTINTMNEITLNAKSGEFN